MNDMFSAAQRQYEQDVAAAAKHYREAELQYRERMAEAAKRRDAAVSCRWPHYPRGGTRSGLYQAEVYLVDQDDIVTTAVSALHYGAARSYVCDHLYGYLDRDKYVLMSLMPTGTNADRYDYTAYITVGVDPLSRAAWKRIMTVAASNTCEWLYTSKPFIVSDSRHIGERGRTQQSMRREDWGMGLAYVWRFHTTDLAEAGRYMCSVFDSELDMVATAMVCRKDDSVPLNKAEFTIADSEAALKKAGK